MSAELQTYGEARAAMTGFPEELVAVPMKRAPVDHFEPSELAQRIQARLEEMGEEGDPVLTRLLAAERVAYPALEDAEAWLYRNGEPSMHPDDWAEDEQEKRDYIRLRG